MLKTKKSSKGKQKIELQKIANKNALFISFSKRKNGIFTKASDLSTLCGTDVAVVVFSPTGRAFSFGCPAVVPIMDRFLEGCLFPQLGSQEEIIRRRKYVHEKNRQVMELSRQVDAARARKAEAEAQLKVASQGLDWLHDWDNVTVQQLDELVESLELLKTRVQNRWTQLVSNVRPSPPNEASGSRVNPMLPFRGVATDDPGPSSSNQGPIVDHAGAPGAGGMMMCDPRWQGFQPMPNMRLPPPITDYYVDPSASSSNAITVAGLPGSSGSAGFGAGWPGIQAMLNPVHPANSVRMVNPYEPVVRQPNPPVEPIDFNNNYFMYTHF